MFLLKNKLADLHKSIFYLNALKMRSTGRNKLIFVFLHCDEKLTFWISCSKKFPPNFSLTKRPPFLNVIVQNITSLPVYACWKWPLKYSFQLHGSRVFSVGGASNVYPQQLAVDIKWRSLLPGQRRSYAARSCINNSQTLLAEGWSRNHRFGPYYVNWNVLYHRSRPGHRGISGHFVELLLYFLMK